MIWIGIAAGMGAPCAWALSDMAHSTGTRLLGVPRLMMLRQLLAVIVLISLCLLAGQFQSYALGALTIAFICEAGGVVICGWCLCKSILRIGIRSALICQSLYSYPKTGRRGVGIVCGADHGVGYGVIEHGHAAGDSPAHALPAAEHHRRRIVVRRCRPATCASVDGFRHLRSPLPVSRLYFRLLHRLLRRGDSLAALKFRPKIGLPGKPVEHLEFPSY